jgi:hypothetical protein
MPVPDLVLLPHADLHTVLNGAGPLNLRVLLRQQQTPPGLSFKIDDVTPLCSFDFFAPYQATGSRLANLPSVDPATGLVTATTPGIYLLQVRLETFYIVARLQVHETILGWWFGNASITVPVDPTFAHAQPSIYASFTDHASGTDPVGDITGHGYVSLTAPAGANVVVAPFGRLRGTADGNAVISGSLGITVHTLPVTMVHYGRVRDELDLVRGASAATPADSHNMVFVSEGFRNTPADRKLFDKIVAKTVDQMFCKPRHQPYGLLGKSFTVWKAYQASNEHGLTCGFRVNETGGQHGPTSGTPIPFTGNLGDARRYTVQDLVTRVGLPRANENRDLGALVPEWSGQSLNAFDAGRVDQPLIDAWKTQKTTGILEASDTFFGFRFGARPGDRMSGGSDPPVLPPANDAVADAGLAPFIKRLYEFFVNDPAHFVLLDPRRNAIEVMADPNFDMNPGTPVMRYLSQLRGRKAPHPAVGQEWQPDPAQTAFRRSVGLVAFIVNDELEGGTNTCASTLTAAAVRAVKTLKFSPIGTAGERPMRRIVPAAFSAKIDRVVDVVAHELGHSLNLGDEYEVIEALDPKAISQDDSRFDNITRLGSIHLHGNVNPNGTITFVDDQINPARVKWLALPRMRVSSVLTVDATAGGGGMVLTIDPKQAAAWVAIKKKNPAATLRARDFPASGKQLDPAGIQVDVTLGTIEEAKGTIAITGASLPPAGSPVFAKGALLFSPLMAAANTPARVVERKVFEKMASTHLALNTDTNNTTRNDKEDLPVAISDYKPPCKEHKVIGVYEGAGNFTGRAYRPAGLCKMRTQSKDTAKDSAEDNAFCFVCKWLIVNRIDANLHALLDAKFYPRARKGGDG